MSELTKEQLDVMEQDTLKRSEYSWLASVKTETMLELLRGYRAWLAEVEHHKNAIKSYEAVGDESCLDKANHHRSRLESLKSEAK